MVGFVAFCSFSGSWLLYKHMATIGWLRIASPLIDATLALSAIFVLIPMARWTHHLIANLIINGRNTERELLLLDLLEPSPELQSRLADAAELRASIAPGLPGRVVYSTDRDLLESELDRLDNDRQQPSREATGTSPDS